MLGKEKKNYVIFGYNVVILQNSDFFSCLSNKLKRMPI